MILRLLTATSLVFDFNNSTFLPPINKFRQLVPDTWRVSVAPAVRPGHPTVRIHPRTEELGPVLLVGQIGEPVQTETEGPVRNTVMLVDEPEVVLEDLEPPVLLTDGVGELAVLHEPLLVHGHDFFIGSPCGGGLGVVVGLVVRDYGHVHGR